jgi:hypothetical protein
MLCRVALVRTDVSEERIASFIRVTSISSGRASVSIYGYVPSSPILVTLMMEAQVPPKRRFLQEPHGVTSQKAPFFMRTFRTFTIMYFFIQNSQIEYFHTLVAVDNFVIF